MTVPVPAVLRTLARLSQVEQPQRVQLDVSKSAGMVWFGGYSPDWVALTMWPAEENQWPIPWDLELARLATFDALHREDRLLRAGWAFLCGLTEIQGQYLEHAEVPPTETAGADPADEWTARLAAELTGLGLTVRTGYPVGQWRVDLVVGARESAVAVETRPHPDGAGAHLARWRALHGAGWRMHDAFGSRFGHDPVRAAVTLAQELRSAGLPAELGG